MSDMCASTARGLRIVRHAGTGILIVVLVFLLNLDGPVFMSGDFKEITVLKWGTAPGTAGGRNHNIFGFPATGPAALTVCEDQSIFVLDSINMRVISLGMQGDFKRIISYALGVSRPFYASSIAVMEDGDIVLVSPDRNDLAIIRQGHLEYLEIQAAPELVLQPWQTGTGTDGSMAVKDKNSGLIVLINREGDVLSAVKDPDADPVVDQNGRIYATRISMNGTLIVYRWSRIEGVAERIAEIEPSNEGWDMVRSECIGIDMQGCLIIRVEEERDIEARNVLIRLTLEGEVLRRRVDIIPDSAAVSLGPTSYALCPSGDIVAGENIGPGYRIRRLGL